MAEFPYPDEMINHTRLQYARVLWTIHIDGPFEEPNGYATQFLVEALEDRGFDISKAVLATMVRELDRDTGKFGKRLIRRDLNEKRCYKIELAVDPKDLPPMPSDFDPNPVPVRGAEDEEAEEEPAAAGAGDDIMARLRGISAEERAEAERVAAEEAAAAPVPVPVPVQVPAASVVVDVPLPPDAGTNGHGGEVTVAATNVFDTTDPTSKLFTAIGLINDVALTIGGGDSTQLAADLARAEARIAMLTRANDELRRALASRAGANA